MLASVLPQLQSMRIVLASGSPRRADALRGLGLNFEQVVSGFAEDMDWREFMGDDVEELIGGESLSTNAILNKHALAAGACQRQDQPVQVQRWLSGAESYCVENARQKAKATWASLGEAKVNLLIAADTVVVSSTGEILEKPSDDKAAEEMLRKLSGRDHWVQSGVCLLLKQPSGPLLERVFGESTTVSFAALTALQIREYVKSGEPFDKAGGYGIQTLSGGSMIERICGCYYNVTGFPVHRFCKELLEVLDTSEPSEN